MDDDDLLKPTGLQKEIEDDAEKKLADQIEEENALNTKNARIRLEEARNLQRSTVDEMHKQNEKLSFAQKTANSTYKQSKEAREKANKLLYEKNFCTIAPNARADFTNWRENKNTSQERLESLKQKDMNSPTFLDSVKEPHLNDCEKNLENKTDRELKKLYEVTVEMNQQTEEQKQAGEQQKNLLKNVIKTSKEAHDEIKKAGEKLDDFNGNN